MTKAIVDQPRNLSQMRVRVRNAAASRGRPDWVMERLMANVIVAQMLPEGVVKGGTALKIRVGDAKTRFSRDLDAARKAGANVDDYIDELGDRLAKGWNGFTGAVRKDRPAKAPPTVPGDYVMQPFRIALSYKGSSWLTVEFELGRDEIGSTERVDWRIAHDIVEFFAMIGLPAPEPIAVLVVDHQIAQKIHACTSVGAGRDNERAHDLVDLQILVREERPNLSAVGITARRLFAARKAQAWPPTVVAFPSWEKIYAEAAKGIDAIPDVHSAVTWANGIIAQMR